MQLEAIGIAVQPLSVRAGDVVVFDVRIDHAGQVPTARERLAHRLFKGVGRVARQDPETLFAKARCKMGSVSRQATDRMGVFMTFGPNTSGTTAFEAGLAAHDPDSLGILDTAATALDPGVQKTLSEKNIAIMRP